MYYEPPPPPSPKPASSLAALVLLVVVFIVGVTVGQSGFFGGGSARPTDNGSPTPTPTANSDGLHGFDLFWQALGIIRQNFVGRNDLNDQTLVYGAIRGLVDALGDTHHTVFLAPQEVQDANDALNLSVVGIGVTVGENGDQVVVLSVLPGSPASAAGIHAGDVFISVDGQSVQGQTIDQIVGQVRGEAGTRVELTFDRPSTGTTVNVTIIRQELHIPGAWWSMVPGTKVAMLRLATFGAGSADDLQASRDAAVAAGATALILDLRGNPGGYVDEAKKVASQFLTDKVVFISEDASGAQTPVTTVPGITATAMPLVVLIDNNTASAAEIVSGAIQSAQRATLVGETTFGTGTVLQVFGLPDGSAIRLATERWLTPDGALIFGKGIKPDIVVAMTATDLAVDPTELAEVAPDQVAALKDPQLLKALDLLGVPLPRPTPAPSSTP
ncbi:MAG: S41 family peptidase [Chloroflexota bacterium]|nr:S41 family peptidase [Chloroflexota bacterium]